MPEDAHQAPHNTYLAPWEVATHVAEAVQPGLVPLRLSYIVTAGSTMALLLILWPALGLAAIPTALVFGRLLALDLTTYTLPNIYTVPLICIGVVFAYFHGQIVQAVFAVLIMLSFSITLSRFNVSLGFGGGDMKLMAALFAFLPLTSAFWAIAAGSMLWLPVAFLKPKAMVPFGVPLILGWSLLLCIPHLPNWLISTIS